MEDEGGRLPRRAHQRLADASQRPPLRRCRIGRRSRRRRADYECCKFRGSIVALDAATGKQVWKTLHDRGGAEADEEERRRHAALGAIGRAGLGDAGDRRRRNRLYVTTGNNYSDPTRR